MFLKTLFAALVLTVSFTAFADLHSQKTLNLKKGVPHEEILVALPLGASFGGDFKEVSKVLVTRNHKKIRFSPTASGKGTLAIRDLKGDKIFEYHLVVQ